MSKKVKIIKVKNHFISVISEGNTDFICLTDLAKAKDGEARAADIVKATSKNPFHISTKILITR